MSPITDIIIIIINFWHYTQNIYHSLLQAYTCMFGCMAAIVSCKAAVIVNVYQVMATTGLSRTYDHTMIDIIYTLHIYLTQIVTCSPVPSLATTGKK